jgi:hypothetical protein
MFKLVFCKEPASGSVPAMNPIQYQATALWQNLCDRDTGFAYKQALEKTWELLTQLIQLLFLSVLVIVAFVVWVWSLGFQSGRGFRNWMESENPSIEKLTSEIVKALLTPVKWFTNWVKSQLKQQLGVDVADFEFKAIESATSQQITLPAADAAKTEKK